MKKQYIMMLLAVAMAFIGCTDKDPYITAGEDDIPRILNTDIAETGGGQPSALPNISRDQNFEFEVIVTPAQYTSVYWYIDGENVYEGNTISMPLLAGDYAVKIVARTTKGKETFRNCTLKVLPLDGDPTLSNDAKSRWLNPGATVTIEGSNLTNIDGAYLKDTKLENFVNNGTSVSFTVPALDNGDYKLILEGPDGRFGCGLVTVTDEKWVDPDVAEIVLWEGAVDINWGDSNVTVTAEQLADVKVGSPIRIYYEFIDAEYHALRITTPWWGDNLEDQVIPQFDMTEETPNPFEFTYTDANKAIVDERGGMHIVGFGFKLTKVTTLMSVAPAAATIWEGDVTINWGDSNVALNCAELGISSGKTINVHYELIEAEYHAARFATGPSWLGDVLPQFDLPADPSGVISHTVTDENIAAINADGGEILLTGFGYKVTKVTMQ